MADKIKDLHKTYDVVFFDVPPTFNRLIASAYLACTTIIIPTFPEKLSIESIGLTIDDIEIEAEKYEAKVPNIHILLNKFNPSRRASKDAFQVLAELYSDKLLPFSIKESADLQNSTDQGKTIFDGYYDKSLRESVTNLANTISRTVKKVSK